MKRVWNKFLLNFINGIVTLLPIAVTIALVRFLVAQVNNIVLNPIVKFLYPLLKGPGHVYVAKMVVFFSVIFIIALIGWGAKIFFLKRIFSPFEKFLFRIPLMGRIYKAAKEIFSAFLGQGKTIFKQVVLLEYPRKGLYTIGFTTGVCGGEIKESIGANVVNVFVPTTPNPTSGYFLIIPKENITFLKMSVEQGKKLIISGGSVSPSLAEGDE